MATEAALRARVAQLEDELATCKAEVRGGVRGICGGCMLLSGGRAHAESSTKLLPALDQPRPPCCNTPPHPLPLQSQAASITYEDQIKVGYSS